MLTSFPRSARNGDANADVQYSNIGLAQGTISQRS